MAAAKKDFSIQQRVCEPIVNRGLESLRRIHFFRALKEPCLKMIAAKLQVCFLAPEEVLAREGEKVDKLWFMGKGTADAVVQGQKVHTYLSRSVIGPPMALLMDQNWTQTVTTTSFSDFMVLTRHDLHIFLTHHESEASKVHAAAFHSQIKLELSGRAPHGHSGHGGHGEERQERQERQKLARRVKTMRSLMSMKSGLDQNRPVAPAQPAAALMNDQHFANHEEFEATQNAIASWLDGIEFFSSFDVFTLELLLSIVRKNTYKTNQDILTQGQRAEALHVIYAGQVDVLIDGLAVSRLGSQSILGERSICALGEEIKPCAATIRPVTSVVITYSWPRTSLLELFIRDDRIYERFKKKFDILTVHQASFRNIRMFQNANVDFVEMLEGKVRPLDLAPGDVLFEGGKPSADAYILCDGAVEIVKDGIKHINIEVTNIADAVLFGEFNVLGLWRSPKATVRATKYSVVKIITTAALRQCFAAFPDESLIFRELVERRIEKDASKDISWTLGEELREELSREEVSLLPRNYVRLFTKDYDQIHLPRDLGEISEFQDLPPKPLEELAALMKLRLYVPQQVILQQGEDLFEIMILQRGTCSAEVFGADLQPMEGPSIVGGIASMITKKVFTTIIAEETCFVGAISKHRFATIMDKYPEFRRELLLQTNISFKRLCDDFHEQMLKASALRSHLAKVEILSEASSDFVAQLAQQMAPCLLLPGQSLVQEPENPKLYFIIEGHLHVMKNGYLVAALSSKSITGILDVYPGPRHAAPVAAAAASMMMAPAAFADEIGDAAKKLGDASYSFAKEVDWNNGIFLQAPGKFQPLEALKAIDKMIEMGAAADPKLLKEAAEAHHKAIGSISGPNGVTSRADWDAVNAALGRVVASVPKAKVMAVYDSVKAITDPGVPAYMKSLVNGPDAEKAYQGFLEFKDVVEKNQVATASAPAVVPSGDKIGEAAKALSDASYPFIKDIDWLSDIYLKPLPGKTAPETLKAIDKMIVMGAKMDGNLLKAAAEAHHKAIGSIDAKGVTSAADYEAVNAAIGRLVASVPKTTVMDVYNSMAGVVDSTVTNNMFSKVNPLDAVAAAKGFYTFKDVVEASQR